MYVNPHLPIVFQFPGSMLRPKISFGQVSIERLTRTPVGESGSGRVKNAFGKGSWQYSGTRGSHGPRE